LPQQAWARRPDRIRQRFDVIRERAVVGDWIIGRFRRLPVERAGSLSVEETSHFRTVRNVTARRDNFP
jgi:hypothetical protein